MAFMAICMATLLRFILVRLNKKLDRGEPVKGAIAVGEAVPGEAVPGEAVPGEASQRGFRFVL